MGHVNKSATRKEINISCKKSRKGIFKKKRFFFKNKFDSTSVLVVRKLKKP